MADLPNPDSKQISAVDKGVKFAKFISLLEPKNAQVFALIVFTLGSIFILGYQIVGRDQFELARDQQAQTAFADLRESQRMHDTQERVKDRQSTQTMLTQVLSTLTSQAERDRVERREIRTDAKNAHAAVAIFATKFAEFEKSLKTVLLKLGMPMPELTPMIHVAPMPKCSTKLDHAIGNHH